MITTILSAGQWLAVILIAVPVTVVVLFAAAVLADRKPAPPKPLRPGATVYDGVPEWGWSVYDPFMGGVLRAPSYLPPAKD